VQLVRFNKVPKKVPGEGLQVQQGSGEGSEKVPGRFPEKVPERVWEDSVEGTLLHLTGLKPSRPSPEPSPELTWLCTKASQTFCGTFSGTFSGTLLNRTYSGLKT
jgi:hypothetical protein